jgi:hypothetical protein
LGSAQRAGYVTGRSGRTGFVEVASSTVAVASVGWAVELVGVEGDHVGLWCLGQLDGAGGGAGQQLGVDGGVERGS